MHADREAALKTSIQEKYLWIRSWVHLAQQHFSNSNQKQLQRKPGNSTAEQSTKENIKLSLILF